MNRKFLVVGDSPVPGGAVLPYAGPEWLVMGHRAALIGGRAYCEGCNSIGLIAKAGGDYRPGFCGSQIALAGDVVVCQCPRPQPILSSLGSNSWCDDRNTLIAEMELTPEFLVPGRLTPYPQTAVAALKEIEQAFEHAPEHEPTRETICPNMTNAMFAQEILQVRSSAVQLLTERMAALDRWNEPAQQNVRMWFGDSTQEIRAYLQKGLLACRRVLEQLQASNFVRYAEGSNEALGCTFPSNANKGIVAAVCKPDVRTHTIAITFQFCELPQNKTWHGTSSILFGDTQLLTLVHEVTHFDDTFSSRDTWFGSKNSFSRVGIAKTDGLLMNADSLASYMLGIDGKKNRS